MRGCDSAARLVPAPARPDAAQSSLRVRSASLCGDVPFLASLQIDVGAERRYARNRHRSRFSLSTIVTAADYERLADAELNAAATADTLSQRRAHLDQASVYATLSETTRHDVDRQTARG